MFVLIQPAAFAPVEPYYGSLSRSMSEVLSRYSVAELELLVDFFTRSHAVMSSEAAKLTQKDKPPERK